MLEHVLDQLKGVLQENHEKFVNDIAVKVTNYILKRAPCDTNLDNDCHNDNQKDDEELDEADNGDNKDASVPSTMYWMMSTMITKVTHKIQ